MTEGPVKLIFITSATPSIELSFQYHYPLTINFADYGYKHLEGNSTYELNLVDAMQMMLGNGKKVEGSASQGNNVQPNANNTANVAQGLPLRSWRWFLTLRALRSLGRSFNDSTARRWADAANDIKRNNIVSFSLFIFLLL